ncbi:MAG: hypothetical protein ACTSUF_09675 [Candidatus Heimdallarchaeaceae archaeon]
MVEQLKPTEDDMKLELERMEKKEVSSDEIESFINTVNATTTGWDMIIKTNLDKIKKLKMEEKDMNEFAKERELNVGFIKEWTNNLREQFNLVMEAFIYQQYVLKMFEVKFNKLFSLYERLRSQDLELKRMEVQSMNIDKVIKEIKSAYHDAWNIAHGQKIASESVGIPTNSSPSKSPTKKIEDDIIVE